MLTTNSITKRAALVCAALAMTACSITPTPAPTTRDGIQAVVHDLSKYKHNHFFEGVVTKLEIRTRGEIYKAKDSGWSTLAGTNTKSAGAGLGLMVGLDLLSALENSARKDERYRVVHYLNKDTGKEEWEVLAQAGGNPPDFDVGDHLFGIMSRGNGLYFYNLTKRPDLIPVIEEGRALGRADKAKREERRSDSIQQP